MANAYFIRSRLLNALVDDPHDPNRPARKLRFYSLAEAERYCAGSPDLSVEGPVGDAAKGKRGELTTHTSATPGEGKRILAIDPGTHCGWAIRHPNGSMHSGVWNLKGGRFEGGGMRFVRLRGYLDQLHAATPVERVAFEEVRRHMGVDAAHIYGGVVATLTAFCEQHKIPYEGIPVGTVKKKATGKGNAQKDAMVAAAKAKWPEQNVADDNQADALWIAATVTEAA